MCSRKIHRDFPKWQKKRELKLPLFVALYLFFIRSKAPFQPGDLGLRYADFGGNLDLRHPKKTQIEDFLFPVAEAADGFLQGDFIQPVLSSL